MQLRRAATVVDTTPGRLLIDAQPFAETIEPLPPVIPAGDYRVSLTTSARVKSGSLWSPDGKNRLPLVEDVPGHTGIRIHAGNTVKDTIGCILVGVYWSPATRRLGASRAALYELMARLSEAEEITLHIDDAKGDEP